MRASWNIVIAPALVMRPTLSPPVVNQSAPSGPAVIDEGLPISDAVKLVTAPFPVMRPML
jgi:hypothetical protein